MVWHFSFSMYQHQHNLIYLFKKRTIEKLIEFMQKVLWMLSFSILFSLCSFSMCECVFASFERTKDDLVDVYLLMIEKANTFFDVKRKTKNEKWKAYPYVQFISLMLMVHHTMIQYNTHKYTRKLSIFFPIPLDT